MRKLVNAVYRMFLLGTMVIGVLFLSGKLPFQDEEEKDTQTTEAALDETNFEQVPTVTVTEIPSETQDTPAVSEEVELSGGVIENNPQQSETAEVQDEPIGNAVGQVETTEQVDDFGGVAEEPAVQQEAQTETPVEQTEVQVGQMETPMVQTETAGRQALQAIADALVTNTEGYEEYFGTADFTVFAEDVVDAFGFQTLASYNLWGHNEQEAAFNAAKLRELGECLALKAGLASGGAGTLTLSVYFDEETQVPAVEYTLDAKQPPVDVLLDLRDKTSMRIAVSNHAGGSNRAVFYDLKLKGADTI